MNKNIRNILTLCLCAAIVFVLFVWCILKPADAVSKSERRPLAQMPKISAQAISKGTFMTDFEKYAVDQFPLREKFRTLKAFSVFKAFLQKDNNDLYVKDGFIAKAEYPLDKSAVERAAEKFNLINKKYLDQSNKVYISLIPDKNYFLAEKSGHLSYDYPLLLETLRSKTKDMTYIDIFDLLEIEDYYKTDTHWRQEKIVPVAKRLAEKMGTEIDTDFKTLKVDAPFYGVYYGQCSLPVPAEEMYYLKNSAIESSKVFDSETDSFISVYNEDAKNGNDLYEFFLSGSKSLLKVENPNAKTDKELILFRDSFGSSIAPLLIDGYKTITLIDIRYISSNVLSRWVDFEGKDVLFLYSTTVLNNSITFK